MEVDPVVVATEETLLDSTGYQILIDSVDNHVDNKLDDGTAEVVEVESGDLADKIPEKDSVSANCVGVEPDNLTKNDGLVDPVVVPMEVESVSVAASTGVVTSDENSLSEVVPTTNKVNVDMTGKNVENMEVESDSAASIQAETVNVVAVENSLSEMVPTTNKINVHVSRKDVENSRKNDSVVPMEVESVSVADSVASTGVVMGNVTDKTVAVENSLSEAVPTTNSEMSRKGVVDLVPSVGEKRMAEDSVVNGNKKPKVDRKSDMKRVAEMVLVLSAMGNMRGGRSPTAAEKEIMAEARDKLINLCEGMAPKDIVPRDAVRVVIEDLGLNRSKDQRLSFRPPMMSIKEKLQLAKTKMEDSKKFAMQSGVYSPQVLQGGFGAKNENHGAYVHVTQRFPQDRSSHAVTGGSETTPSTNHTNEGQSTMVSRGAFGSPFERETSSLPLTRTEALHFRLDGRPNVPTYPSQVRASSSGDHMLGKTPTSKFQLGPVTRVGVANKVPDHKVDGTPVMGASQTAYGGLQAVQKPSQGLNFVHVASTNSNHNEIAKNVQKFLHPRLPERPSWNPPSTDYMNKSLTCQACKVSINDVESLLVCDACEKGHHLKCLQSYNQKGIPKGEWHCPTCLMASNGKPLPPKYGRVTRNSTVPKASSNTTAVQASAEKKVENLDQNVNYQKATANGNSGYLHPAHVGQAGNIHVGATVVLKMSNPREAQAVNSSGNKVKMEGTPLSEPKLLKDSTGSAVSSGKPNESSTQQFQSREASVSDGKSQSKCEPAEACLRKPSEAGIDSCHSSQDVGKHVQPKLAEISSDHGQDHDHNTKTPDSRETSECKPGFDVRKDGQDAAQTVSVGNVGVGHGARDCPKSSLDTLPCVDWIGDILQVVDEKAFYKSCHINGTVYKLHDHALFRSNNGNLRPSKLQALWEDTKTGSKWAIVNSCYFPADLPEVVGRPCSPENNEVYESNHGSTVRAGLVQGPCHVLPPNNFKEESERRIQTNNITQPVFLCKWFYDESKGLFRPVTD